MEKSIREILDSYEYVVQYRKAGTKTWHDTHCQSFRKPPTEQQALKELTETCIDLSEWDGRSKSYVVKSDYAMRVIRREIVEKVSIISPAKKFSRALLRDMCKKLHP